ncbi:glycosyltransferase [Fervidibacillus albus]|uniref:Glycosyltransferase n=1 Tax=Fervidibacillus albus TaxID=2980026 RepID=A0A9E8RV98_9BACI|nr:glycosyltransferase [Fervidibacillus albus]WAA09074.1 glycosyltransferase [Fervidibacillus albus]
MAEYVLYISLFIIWFMLFYHMFLMEGGFFFSLRFKRTYDNYKREGSTFPSVTILIPAHNEEMVIENTIKSLIKLHYPKKKLEIIVINDHSTDGTGVIADLYASKYPYIKVIHNYSPDGGKGKSGALNIGFAHSSGEIIVVYDADNRPEPDSVKNLVLPLEMDEKAGAAVGKFRVINANKNVLTRFINIETITFQWLAQAGRWFWFKLATIPGTNFSIRRSVLEKLGGWDENALSEDTELSIRVYNLGYRIHFFPAAITWEQEPETWRVWWKQRTRWASGNMYVISKYLLHFRRLKTKKVFIDLFYFLSTYLFFFAGILISHSIFLLNLFFDLNIDPGIVSYVLLIIGFLLFVTEILLALSMEKKQLNVFNGFAVIMMYFVYSQLWLLLILYSSFAEMKRMLLKRERKWYKTERYREVS